VIAWQSLSQILEEELAGHAIPPLVRHRLERRLEEEIALRFQQAEAFGWRDRRQGDPTWHQRVARGGALTSAFAGLLGIPSETLTAPSEYDQAAPEASPPPAAPLAEQDP